MNRMSRIKKIIIIFSMAILSSTLWASSPSIASSYRPNIAVGDVFSLYDSDKLAECQSQWAYEFSYAADMPATGTLSTDAIVWMCDGWAPVVKRNADSLCATIAANSGLIAELTPITRRYGWFFETFIEWGCEVTSVR